MKDFDTLVHLADNLYSRYEGQGNLSDLSLCIVHYQSALALSKSSTILSNDIRSKLFSNIANALSIRFQRHGDIADLNNSVDFHLKALEVSHPGHPGRANTLSNFATALLVRYGKLGMQKDIELAIEHFNTALSLLPLDRRLMPLMNYASSLFSRFQNSGNISDLNEAIHQYRAVANTSPAENKSTSYYNLANALMSRFKLKNDPTDLELCIECSHTALRGMNESHPDRFLALSCLSTALVRRFELHGVAEDLETAVENFKSALELRFTEDSSQFMAFYDLADALMMRYEMRSDLPDLELSIQHYRTALSLLSPNHKDEGVLLDNLGNALFLRFSRLRSLNDLEEAIQKHFFALGIRSEDSRRRVTELEALGACLDARFEQLCDPEDLHAAVDLYNEALIEMSQSHPRRTEVLKKIANSLETRFKFYGGIADLDRSISYCREALELLPHHLDQATSYQVLASSLLSRFEETGDEFDLDEAYLCCSTSMNMRNAPDSLRATCNLLLARILKARVLPWETRDVELIFQHLRVAKDLCTLDHPLISDVYAESASAYYLRFLVEQRSTDLYEAFGNHELSVNVASGCSWPAFRVSLQSVRDAETFAHPSGIDVYRNALRLANLQILAMRSPELRQCFVRRHGATLAYDSASFALRFQKSMEAIEALEGGRSLLWSQLVRGKTCLDELRLTGERGASLAEGFGRLSYQLECASSDASKSSRDVKSLLKEKEVIVEQIRRLDGFKYFLRFTPFSELENAALEGPVVVLNANQSACDALILLHNTIPIHVRLSRITQRDVSRIAKRFKALTGKPAAGRHDEDALKSLLADVWDRVVSPIVQRLLPHIPKGSRLWWCPAGAFTSIPLHAAGRYREGDQSLSQLYLSSYAPTLQSLIRARAGAVHEGPRAHRSNTFPGFLKHRKTKPSLGSQMSPSVVAIGRASDEASRALGRMRIRIRIPPDTSFRQMEGEGVTSNAVLAAFQEPVWLHLACPASLNSALPCRSGFVTKDGTLSLHDISTARPRAEFAFLAGRCHKEDDSGLEEMHLAASLQYSGVRSVIGTLWPVDDEIMRRVAAAFYEQVTLKGGGSLQHTNTAQSLVEALSGIGNGISLAQKFAFVHVGA